MEDLLKQTCHEMRIMSADSEGSRWFTFDPVLPNQFIKGM